MGSGRSEVIDISGEIRAETAKAIRFYDGAKTVWLPKSQIEINDDGTITVPEWLGIEKGLL